jgi:hypothetical protein
MARKRSTKVEKQQLILAAYELIISGRSYTDIILSISTSCGLSERQAARYYKQAKNYIASNTTEDTFAIDIDIARNERLFQKLFASNALDKAGKCLSRGIQLREEKRKYGQSNRTKSAHFSDALEDALSDLKG